jgi:hypothetical protein
MQFKFRDLGLEYEAALHGVQSAVKFEMQRKAEQEGVSLPQPIEDRLKHLRVGIDASKADHVALAFLMVSKGVFTWDEYAEAMRIGMNEELERYTQHCIREYGLPPNVKFR